MTEKTKKIMAYSLIGIGTALLIGGLALAIKSMKPMHFNVIAGLVLLVISVFTLLGKQAQDKSSSEKSDKLLKKIDDQTKVINTLSEENEELRSEVTSINDNITGKDSYCYATLHLNYLNGGASLSIHHIGRYTLKNVEVSLVENTHMMGYFGQPTYPGRKVPIPKEHYGGKFYGNGETYIKTIAVLSPEESSEQLNEAIGLADDIQHSFNLRFKDDKGKIWFQRILLRQIDAYPSNPLLKNQPPFMFKWASQLYLIPKVPHNERLKYPDGDDTRFEKILLQGDDWHFEGFRSVEPQNRERVWYHFPLKEGEKNPFDEWRIHYDGKGERYDYHVVSLYD